MNIKNIKKSVRILKEEITDNLKLSGIHNKNFGLLCEAVNNLDNLINRLENPDKYKKIDKLRC